MKAKLVTKTNTDSGSKELPDQFLEPVRPDLIKRAVLAIQANNRQKYGAKPEAGKRHSVRISKKRRDYRTSYGYGISRVPRKIISRRGTRMNWEGAFAPGTVGGRRAHPPKASKNWDKKINKKENRKAIRSAIAATAHPELVKQRGHKVPKNYPLVVKDLEAVAKTAELRKNLEKLGFKDELQRCEVPREKSGRAARRGRRKSHRKGLLMVVGEEQAPVLKAASNLPGVDAVYVNHLNAELLAPGTHHGRITIYTDKAIDALKEGIFTSKYTPPKVEVKK